MTKKQLNNDLLELARQLRLIDDVEALRATRKLVQYCIVAFALFLVFLWYAYQNELAPPSSILIAATLQIVFLAFFVLVIPLKPGLQEAKDLKRQQEQMELSQAQLLFIKAYAYVTRGLRPDQVQAFSRKARELFEQLANATPETEAKAADYLTIIRDVPRAHD